jgi:hypothetical protein
LESTDYGNLFQASDFSVKVVLSDLVGGGAQMEFNELPPGLSGVGDWFSFRRTANGTVSEVLYSPTSSSEGVMWKKAVASLFSMFLQLDKSSYSILEVDHTGQHWAHYNVDHQSKNVAVVTKTSSVRDAILLAETTKVMSQYYHIAMLTFLIVLQTATVSAINNTVMSLVMNRSVRPLTKEERNAEPLNTQIPDGLFVLDSVTTEGKFPKFREMKSTMTVTLQASWPLSNEISQPAGLITDDLELRLVSIT